MEFTQAGRADVFCRSSELARRTGEENWLRTLWQYLFEMWQFIVQRWGILPAWTGGKFNSIKR
jgi:hypothetical protein